MWCLARLLPLLIANKIPEDNPEWQNFILLLRIMEYVFSPVLSLDAVAYLRMIINEHHETFLQIYPSCRITPKLHYVLHYPEWIAKLVIMWLLFNFVCI